MSLLAQEDPAQSQRGQRPGLGHLGVGVGPGFGMEAAEKLLGTRLRQERALETITVVVP